VKTALVYDSATDNIEDFQEECDMGIYNIDPDSITDGTHYLYPCTHQCMWNTGFVNREADADNEPTGYYADDTSNAANVSFYQQIWDCNNVFTDSGSGTGTHVSECTMKMGDGVLDWDLGERCEPGLRVVKTLRASDATGADISGNSDIGSTTAGYDCGTETGLTCSDMGVTTGSTSDGPYGITASTFRWDATTIMNTYNFGHTDQIADSTGAYSENLSPIRNYMLMGCWHTIVAHTDSSAWTTHSSSGNWPRLA
jgi:hypothetical protein